jgi:peptide chain release factor subunit 3
MGTIIMGKIESGCCRVGDRCVIMPNRTRVEVTNIYYEDNETDSCVCGENVRLKLKNVEEVSLLVLLIFIFYATVLGNFFWFYTMRCST